MIARIGNIDSEIAAYPFPSGGVPRLATSDKIGPEIKTFPANDPARDHLAHNHYFKRVAHLEYIDVYRVLDLFGITDHAIGHALKKLLVAGGRGAGKDIGQDIQEAIDSLVRWKEMQVENGSK